MGIYDRNYYRDDLPALKPWDRYSMVANLIILNVALLLANFIFTNRSNFISHAMELSPSHLMQPWNWYRFLTYGFMHGDVWHLLFNMLTLYFLGQAVENRYGKWEFLRFYLLTIVVCGVLHAVFGQLLPATLSGATVIGASGGVVAVVMLFVYNFPNATLMLWGVLPVPAWAIGVLTVLANVFGTQRFVAYDVHLLGIAIATIYYFGNLNFDGLGRISQSFSNVLKRKPKLRIHKDEDDVPASRDEQEADRLLDKIYREGQGSLTVKEQKFLEQYSRRVREKRNS